MGSYNMALSSNSSAAAIAIIGEIAHQLVEPKRLFKAMQLSPAQAAMALAEAMEAGDWDQVAIIGLSQSSFIAS
jgi:hypothetical protein